MDIEEAILYVPNEGLAQLIKREMEEKGVFRVGASSMRVYAPKGKLSINHDVRQASFEKDLAHFQKNLSPKRYRRFLCGVYLDLQEIQE